MKRILFWIMMGTLALCPAVTYAQIPGGTHWQLVREKEGIQVYTAPGGASGRKYIRVKASLPGSVKSVEKLFLDIGRQKAWVYGTRTSHLVQKIDDNNLLYYNETNLPWPVSNRDVVIRMQLEEDPGHKCLSITQTALPDVVPVNKGVVRISHLWGNWQFREDNPGRLQVDYYLDLDPGGSLPAWVVNLFITKGPYETFVKLREQLVSQQ